MSKVSLFQAVRATAAVALFAPAVCLAAGSLTIPVTATIMSTCNFVTSSPTSTLVIANIGALIDESLGTNAVGTLPVQYRCSNGTTPVFGFTGGSSLVLNHSSGTGSMTAAMTTSAPQLGTGMSNPLDLTVTGTIVPAGYQNKKVGVYSASIILTVTP